MRSHETLNGETKAIIGFGCIWGLFAFGMALISSFTIGSNDTGPEIAAIALYGLTILPSCILAIWHRKASAIWLIVLSLVSAFGTTYQLLSQASRDGSRVPFGWGEVGLLLVIGIPGLLGLLLHRSDRHESSPILDSDR